jgi:hypothetical protein
MAKGKCVFCFFPLELTYAKQDTWCGNCSKCGQFCITPFSLSLINKPLGIEEHQRYTRERDKYLPNTPIPVIGEDYCVVI